jgi:2-polyprenyl-6-hydroxyphenyl methylase/3-demethylubiquinone-9 3-methyltransferase
MPLPSTPASSNAIPCKICRRPAALFVVADFNKSCMDHIAKPLAAAGVPVPYHRCAYCGFLFTNAFDRFTPADFSTHIYNEGYALVDPEYAEIRPRSMAADFAAQFQRCGDLRILDYGCGSGLMARCLRAAGFANITAYDPLVPEHAARPAGVFDLILCVEVIEHLTTPVEAFRDLAGFLADPGLLVFTTLLQPADIEQTADTWWYLAPRNGHVSLHTKRSLEYVAGLAGCKAGSVNQVTHCAFKTMPKWLERTRPDSANPA